MGINRQTRKHQIKQQDSTHANAPINGLPWGYNPGTYQGEREEYWGVTNTMPPRDTGEIKKFAFVFLEGERRGGFLMS